MAIKVEPSLGFLGTDSGVLATVTESGSISPIFGNYQVEWWVGEEEHWYRPESETTLAHRRVGSAPVFETSLTISSGRIVAKTWAAIGREAQKPSVITELSNESSAPVAVAIVVTPFNDIKRLRVEKNSLIVDERSQVTVDRPPGYYLLQEGSENLENLIFDGKADKEIPPPLKSRKKSATGALIVPLTHKSGLRFVIAPTIEKKIDPGSLPDFSRVETGWGQRLKTSTTTSLPNKDLGGLGPRDLVDLLISSPTPQGAIRLAAWGLADDASERIASADPNPQWLSAAIELWIRHRRVEDFLPSGAVKIEPLVRSLGKKDALGQVLTSGLTSLLRAIGEDRAARDLNYLDSGFPDSLLSPFDDLVSETNEGVQLLSKSLPQSWYGKDFELHGMATRWGRLGFAIRWHGENAALLWEIEPHDDLAPLITIPGLQKEFSTLKTEGETLLIPLPPKDNNGTT